MDHEDCSPGSRAAMLVSVLVLALTLALASVVEVLVPVAAASARGRGGAHLTTEQRPGDARDALAQSRRGVDAEVVGGKPVPQGRFTFMTFVRFETDSGAFQCGGSLIDPRFVLTAAHCTQDPFTHADLPPAPLR